MNIRVVLTQQSARAIIEVLGPNKRSNMPTEMNVDSEDVAEDHGPPDLSDWDAEYSDDHSDCDDEDSDADSIVTTVDVEDLDEHGHPSTAPANEEATDENNVWNGVEEDILPIVHS